MNDVALKVEGTDVEIQPQEMDVYKPSQVLSPERIAFLWDLTLRIARSSMVPLSLRTSDGRAALPQEQIDANVFFVVEISDRWGISPFALLPCAAVVHGKLGFEGKVIDAVLEGVYGIKLEYDWSGEGEDMKIVVSGSDRRGVVKPIDGTVKDWKTTGNGSPWKPSTYRKMLAYRGAREWARLHKSVAILGILSIDEIEAIDSERRAHQATDVSRPGLDRFRSGSGGADAADLQRQIADASDKQIKPTTTSERERVPAEAERRSEGSADRTNGNEPSGKTPSSAETNGSIGETSGGGENLPLHTGDTPSDADMLLKFSTYLFTVTDGGMRALRPAASKWREENAGWPNDGKSSAAEKINTIYAVHSKRLAGNTDAEQCSVDVAGVIAAK